MKKNKKPDITVIIPVYNVEKYLKKCLDSVINQTFPNIEIICVNDGSTDNSLQILQEYSSLYDNIRIISYEKNKGQAYARNRALEIALGDFIGFVDSDDKIDNNYYEYLYNKAVTSNADIVCGKVISLDGNKQELCTWLRAGNIDSAVLELTSDKLERVFENASTSSCKHIYNVNLLKKHNIVFPENYFHEDEYFNILAYYYANKVITEGVDTPKYYYVNNPNSTTHLSINSKKYKKLFYDQLVIIDKIYNFLKQVNIDDKTMLIFQEDFEHIINNAINWIDKKHLLFYLNNVIKLKLNAEYKKSIIKKRNSAFLQNIFSIKNEIRPNKKHKVITVLGIRLKIRRCGKCKK